MNIFTILHKERGGKTQPIISMDAQHLVNYLNWLLIKHVRELVEDELQSLMSDAIGSFAPEGMSEKQRKVFGYKPRPSQEEVDRIKAEFQSEIDDFERLTLEDAFMRALPYIAVGVARNDTRDGVVRILQEVTGITDRVILPDLITEPKHKQLGDGITGESWRTEDKGSFVDPDDFDGNYDLPF